MARQHLHRAGAGQQIGGGGGPEAPFPQIPGQGLGGAGGTRQHGDAVALGFQRFQLAHQARHLPVPGGQGVAGGVYNLF